MRTVNNRLLAAAGGLALVVIAFAPSAAPAVASSGPTVTSATQAGTGDPVLFTDVRVARQAGYDRIVWEFAGGGTPGWTIGYVPEATGQGSGEIIPLAGSAVLSVDITNVGLPGDVTVPSGVTGYAGPAEVVPTGTTTVRQVHPGSVFEGHVDSFVGTTSEAPFRVSLLSDPTRLVVDIPDAVRVPTTVPSGDGTAGWDGQLGGPVALTLAGAALLAMLAGIWIRRSV